MNYKDWKKIHSEQLNKMVIEPSDGLFEKIMEKRAAKKAGIFGWSGGKIWMGMAATVAVVFVSVYLLTPFDGKQQQNSTAVKTNSKATMKTELNSVSDAESIVAADKNQTPDVDKDTPNHNVSTAKKNLVFTENQRQISSRSPLQQDNKKVVVDKVAVADKSLKANNGTVKAANNIEQDKTADNQNIVSATIGNNNLQSFEVINAVGRMARKDFAKIKSKNYNTTDFNSFMPIKDNLKDYKPQRQIYADIFMSPAFFVAKYSNTTSVVDINKNTKEKLSYTIGTRARTSLSSKIDVWGGVQFTQVNEKYTYSPSSYTTTRVDTIVGVVVDPGSNPIFIYRYDTITNTITPKASVSTYSYKMFELPIGFSYSITARKWETYINAGVISTLIKSTHLQTLDGSFRASGGMVKSNFSNSLLFSGYLSSTIGYNLDSRKMVYAEPYYRASLGDIFKSQSANARNLNAAGIMFGIRYRL